MLLLESQKLWSKTTVVKMKVEVEVLIKNYNIDKKEYELGGQKRQDLSRTGLVSLLNELPVVDHYLKIEIKTAHIDIIKIGPNHYTYRLFHRNMQILKKENVEYQSLLEIIDELGIFNNQDTSINKKLSNIKFINYKIFKYFPNSMIIILQSMLSILYVILYIGIILIKELTVYEHFYFLFIIGVLIYSVSSSIYNFANSLKNRVLTYGVPIIEEYIPFDASPNIFQLTTTIGLGFFVSSLPVEVSFNAFLAIGLLAVVANFPNLSHLYKNYSKSKKKKQDLILFLSEYLQIKSNSSLEKNYIFSALTNIEGKKILSYTQSNKVISFMVLILSILSPLF